MAELKFMAFGWDKDLAAAIVNGASATNLSATLNSITQDAFSQPKGEKTTNQRIQ